MGHFIKSASSPVDPLLAGRVLERVRSRNGTAPGKEVPVVHALSAVSAEPDVAPISHDVRTGGDAQSERGDESRTFRDALPHPVARALRQFEQEPDPVARVMAAQRLGGALVQTLGCLAAAWSASSNQRLPALSRFGEKLRRQGPSLGDWLAVLRESGEAARRQGADALGLATATQPRKGNKGLVRDLEALIQERNDAVHGDSPPTTGEATARLAVLEPLLESALAGTSVLKDQEWLLVDRSDWNRGREAYQISATVLLGDHPDFERRQLWVKEPTESGLVYVRQGHGTLLQLHPFVTVRDCATCHSRELWLVDRVSQSSAKLRSFTTGHKAESDYLAEEIYAHIDAWTFMQ